MTKMYVIKRKTDKYGQPLKEVVSFAKIQSRIDWLVKEPYELTNINTAELTQLVISGVKDGIKTTEIDDYTATLSAVAGIRHNEYLTLAARIMINNHHKNTLNSFADKISMLY